MIPKSRYEELFIYIEATEISGAQNDLTLTVSEVQLALMSTSATLSRNGPGARIHLTALGAGFNDVTEFRLEPAGGGDALIADDVELVATDRAELRFELEEASAGLYDLVAENTAISFEAQLPGSFEIVDDQGGPVVGAELGGPSFVRFDRWTRLTLDFRNDDVEESLSPFFKVEGSSIQFRLDREVALRDNSVLFLGNHPNGVQQFLPPRGKGTLALPFSTDECRGCDTNVTLKLFSPTASD